MIIVRIAGLPFEIRTLNHPNTNPTLDFFLSFVSAAEAWVVKIYLHAVHTLKPKSVSSCAILV
jgi:hypothetical protein